MLGMHWHKRSLKSWVVALGACLAIAGQVSVAVAVIAEARAGRGADAHVEAAGTSAHYAHSDECALCQVRSLQVVRAEPIGAFWNDIVRSAAVVPVAERSIATVLVSSRQSRAPPSIG